ncbi:hypothetical protein DJ94_5024 [Bacillus pseudomycoides]|nr:hypothetical protein DJ94_5024 [Bacillus pseudomycoides]
MMHKQSSDFKITIRGRCDAKNQNEIDKFYYMLMCY